MNDLTDALCDATRRGDLVAMRLLLAAGADADEPGGAGEMPALAVSADGGHLEAVRLLLDHGAEVYGFAEFGNTALHLAVSHDDEHIARLLLDRGAPINARCEGDLTPLYFAVEAGAVHCARLLVDRGADASIRNWQGHTVLQLSQIKSHDALITLLQEAGAPE